MKMFFSFLYSPYIRIVGKRKSKVCCQFDETVYESWLVERRTDLEIEPEDEVQEDIIVDRPVPVVTKEIEDMEPFPSAEAAASGDYSNFWTMEQNLRRICAPCVNFCSIEAKMCRIFCNFFESFSFSY